MRQLTSDSWGSPSWLCTGSAGASSPTDPRSPRYQYFPATDKYLQNETDGQTHCMHHLLCLLDWIARPSHSGGCMHHPWRYTIATAGQDHARSRELGSRIMSASTSWRAKAHQPIGRRATVSGRSAFSWLRGLPVGSDGDQNGIPGVDHARESPSRMQTYAERRSSAVRVTLRSACKWPWPVAHGEFGSLT